MAQPFDISSAELAGEPVQVAPNVDMSGILYAPFAVSENGILVYETGAGSSNAQQITSNSALVRNRALFRWRSTEAAGTGVSADAGDDPRALSCDLLGVVLIGKTSVFFSSSGFLRMAKTARVRKSTPIASQDCGVRVESRPPRLPFGVRWASKSHGPKSRVIIGHAP
jgi:hypothetical protein